MKLRFESDGLESLIGDLEKNKNLLDEAAPEMLKAGAEVIIDCWKDAIRAHDLIDTGDMLNSVKAFYVISPNSKYADIYPDGIDCKGVRNGEKAFINHYGATNRKATHFVSDAETKAEEPAVNAMAEIWYSKLEG